MLSNALAIALFVSIASVVCFYLRKFVRKNAPFYGRTNILIVGGTLGVSCQIATFLYWSTLSLSSIMFLVLAGIEIAVISAIAYRPDHIDWANKTKQTTFVAQIGSLATAAVLYWISG
jgi:hypothetical protein